MSRELLDHVSPAYGELQKNLSLIALVAHPLHKPGVVEAIDNKGCGAGTESKLATEGDCGDRPFLRRGNSKYTECLHVGPVQLMLLSECLCESLAFRDHARNHP